MQAKEPNKILIIGAGWYGLHIANELVKKGYQVVVAEKNSDIFNEVSGNFGVRLHTGPHYPRSEKTRESCRRCFDPFIAKYPDLIVPTEYSIYGLGGLDATFQPSKVNYEQFASVAKETPNCQIINPQSMGYSHEMLGALNVKEPSIALGDRLRSIFKAKYLDPRIQLRLNTTVFDLESLQNCVSATFLTPDGSYSEIFDKVINATCFSSFYPTELMKKFNVEVKYQTLLAVRVKDSKPSKKPISMIVMDGWYPCIMPYPYQILNPGQREEDYIVTHGMWTTQGSFDTPREAYQLLNLLEEHPLFVLQEIRSLCFSELDRFWPGFSDRFHCVGWKGAVLPKLVTDVEFRSAVTFESKNIIHVFPGKISNVLDAADEVLQLIQNQNIEIKYLGGRDRIRFTKNGVLNEAFIEMTTKPRDKTRSTTSLQTFEVLRHKFKDYEIRRTPSSPNFHVAPSSSSTDEDQAYIPGTYSESKLC